MPPILAQPSEENDDLLPENQAFHIINEESETVAAKPVLINLPSRDQTSLAVNEKPNVIVYPTRRITTTNTLPTTTTTTTTAAVTTTTINRTLAEQRKKNFTRSNGYIYTPTQNLKSNNFSSLSNLNTKKNDEFTLRLDEKLRKLQNHGGKQPEHDTRKPFMTVVKTGTFLKPPPNVAQKLLLEPETDVTSRHEKVVIAKKLYAYANRPKVLNRTNTKCKNLPMNSDTMKAVHHNIAALASNVAGLARVRREANGQWKVCQSGDAGYGNIMFDKRIHRGNTYALQPVPCPGLIDEETLAARAAEARRRAMCRQKVKDKQAYQLRLRLGSPPPVKGRKHEPVQTELYLEELFEHPDTLEISTQTDLFLDRPKSPFYYPAKVGIDVATQIYPGDLFDFDIEVQPILEVLVGKTIEQSLIEVLEEEELEALREQQRRFEEIRKAECAEAQRLEERERRYRQEKDRRVAEHIAGTKAQQETEERIAAAVLMQGYIANLLPSVLEGLKEDGFLLDNMKAEVDDSFMPWLMKEVTTEVENMVTSRDLLSDIVKEILETRHEIYRALGEAEEPFEPQDFDMFAWSDDGEQEQEEQEEEK